MATELRNAIPSHHTETSKGAWYGPENKTNLKLDQKQGYYFGAFAWYDEKGDPTKKSTYKFIHHDVSADGTIGPANIRGCQTGIGVLNGAMGGADIPDEDRKGVWRHLATHLKDAGVEPAELNSAPEASQAINGGIEERKAIAIHHTGTTDDSWDGDENTKNLREGEDAAYYHGMFAWVDPDGDTAKKSSYKFPHHMVASNGKIGAANIKACTSGIGNLNGGRGGTTIPEADKHGVWAHLAAHFRILQVDVPELKSAKSDNLEYRLVVIGQPLQLRAGTGNSPGTIHGHFAKYGKMSNDLGGWKEIIRKGAFDRTLDEVRSGRQPDVSCRVQHEGGLTTLGRTSTGTCTLDQDEEGPTYDVILPDTMAGRDIACLISRGDINKSSFAFSVPPGGYSIILNHPEENCPVRCLEDVDLFDVAPVDGPAYESTDVSMRSRSIVVRRIQAERPQLRYNREQVGRFLAEERAKHKIVFEK